MEFESCPFCGSDRVYYIETKEQNYTDHVEGFIWCHGCNFTSDVFLDPEIAAEKWNRRVKDVLSKYADTMRRLKCEGWYLQRTKFHDGCHDVATMPIPEPPKEET